MDYNKFNFSTLKNWFWDKNKFYIDKTSQIVRNQSKIKRSNIQITKSSNISIEDNCNIFNSQISINKGTLFLAKNVSLKNAIIIIDEGSVFIGENSRIMGKIWVRYHGNVKIGNYTNINMNSELRSDESITIGDFTQISYNVSIWDTNTHCIYPTQKRRELSQTIGIGNEIEKPVTRPVKIGNDCWIGKNCAIMKGCLIGDNVIVGNGTTLVNKTIENDTIVVPQIELKYKTNKNNITL